MKSFEVELMCKYHLMVSDVETKLKRHYEQYNRFSAITDNEYNVKYELLKRTLEFGLCGINVTIEKTDNPQEDEFNKVIINKVTEKFQDGTDLHACEVIYQNPHGKIYDILKHFIESIEDNRCAESNNTKRLYHGLVNRYIEFCIENEIKNSRYWR